MATVDTSQPIEQSSSLSESSLTVLSTTADGLKDSRQSSDTVEPEPTPSTADPPVSKAKESNQLPFVDVVVTLPVKRRHSAERLDRWVSSLSSRTGALSLSNDTKRQRTIAADSPTDTDSHNPSETVLTNEHMSALSDTSRTIHIRDVVHDADACMFSVRLNNKGLITALCYLPTQYSNVVEFYHTEIPSQYLNHGLGDLLATAAFAWAYQTEHKVIATCPFIKRFVDSRRNVKGMEVIDVCTLNVPEGLGIDEPKLSLSLYCHSPPDPCTGPEISKRDADVKSTQSSQRSSTPLLSPIACPECHPPAHLPYRYPYVNPDSPSTLSHTIHHHGTTVIFERVSPEPIGAAKKGRSKDDADKAHRDGQEDSDNVRASRDTRHPHRPPTRARSLSPQTPRKMSKHNVDSDLHHSDHEHNDCPGSSAEDTKDPSQLQQETDDMARKVHDRIRTLSLDSSTVETSETEQDKTKRTSVLRKFVKRFT